MKVSVILPTYNEANNIVKLVGVILKRIPDDWQCEILIVDDNSPDGTYQIAETEFKNDDRVKVILRRDDKGFAKSIRCGLERASGDQVIVMDTDFTHDPDDIPTLLHVGKVYDIVSGSRFCAGGQMVDLKHYLCSMIYNWILRIVIHTQIQDNLGGYWTAKRNMILSLPLDHIFFGYGDYYFRLLHFAQIMRYSILEIPAKYLIRFSGTSKSNWMKMMYRYTVAALALKMSSLETAAKHITPRR